MFEVALFKSAATISMSVITSIHVQGCQTMCQRNAFQGKLNASGLSSMHIYSGPAKCMILEFAHALQFIWLGDVVAESGQNDVVYQSKSEFHG